MPEPRASLKLPAVLESLETIRLFVRQGAAAASLPEDRLAWLDLVLEEIIMNIVRHAYQEGQGDVQVDYRVEDSSALGLRITDWGIAYDPLSRDLPSLEGALTDRPVGGLGVFLLTSLVESVTYERVSGANVLALRFGSAPAA